MDSGTAMLIGSVLGLGGSMFGSKSSAKSQKSANDANLMIAREQMAFQERMANSVHQRQVEDLRKAGLNPILSANSGAPAPMGASATMISESPNKGELALASIRAGQEIASAKQDIQLKKQMIKESEGKVKAQDVNNKLVEAQTDLTKAQEQVTSGGELRVGGSRIPFSTIISGLNGVTADFRNSMSNSARNTNSWNPQKNGRDNELRRLTRWKGGAQ